MKDDLLAIARTYMKNLFCDMNYSIHNFDITLKDFNAYESEHIEYVYSEKIVGSEIYGGLTVLVDGEIEFTCSANIAR